MFDSKMDEIKQIIQAITSALGQSCSLHELRKDYFQETGENLDYQIRQIRGVSLFNFLKNECFSFCQVCSQNGVRVYRKSSDKSYHLDHLTKSGHKIYHNNHQPQVFQSNAAPIHFMNQSSINPLNILNPAAIIQEAIQQNLTWYNANMQLLNVPNLSPVTLGIILQQMKLASSNIFEIHRLRYGETHQQATSSIFPLTAKEPSNASTLCEVQPKHSKLELSLKDLKAVNPNLSVKEASTNAIDVIRNEHFVIPRPNMKRVDDKTKFKIHIIKVKSPSHFWFHYGLDQDLSELMCSMQEFYSSLTNEGGSELFHLNRESIKQGLHVAAKIFDCWHRAQIYSLPDFDANVQMFFTDFGTHDKVHLSNIRYLLHDFGSSEYSVKALCGSLSGVSRIGCDLQKECQWTREAIKAFEEAVFEKDLFAVIRKYREYDKTYCYDLEITNNNSSSVAVQLIAIGLAKPKLTSGEYYAIQSELK